MSIDQLVKEISEKMTQSGKSQKEINIKIVIEAAKKEFTMLECRKATGFFSSDEKKDNYLANKFNTQIIKPIRDYLANHLFNLNPTETDKLFSRGTKTEADKAKIITIRAKLPAVTRGKPKAKQIDVGSLFND